MASLSVVPEAKHPKHQGAKSSDVPASEVSAAMHREDRFAQHMGMTIEEVSLGTARLSMVIRDEMANGHDMGHGGSIFSLADTAMAHACNSYNCVAVAVSCSIEFIAAAKRGDEAVTSVITFPAARPKWWERRRGKAFSLVVYFDFALARAKIRNCHSDCRGHLQ